MSRSESQPRTPTHSRRHFLRMAGGALGLAATGCASGSSVSAPASSAAPRTYSSDRFDPWIELDRSAWTHNVREASRLAGGRPILAVVKNNAYGLGDRAVGPMLANMREVGGIACVRVEEAITLREEGVTKPIVVMAEASEDEIVELAHHDALPSMWLDDAPQRLERVSRRLGRPVPVQLFVDTGDEPGGNALHPGPSVDRGADHERPRRRERDVHHVLP